MEVELEKHEKSSSNSFSHSFSHSLSGNVSGSGNNNGMRFLLTKYDSRNLDDSNIDEVVENEKRLNLKLIEENEKVKKKNFEIQKKLLSYIEEENCIRENNAYEDIEKYKIVLKTAKEYVNKLKILYDEMNNETLYLFEEFFKYIRDAIIKQNDMCYAVKEDLRFFRMKGMETIFQKNFLNIRKMYEHNSILRAQITLCNNFRLKNENLIHANFEQLEQKYKNLRTKEQNLQRKIENLNKKIIKSTQKKLHVDEKKMYLEILLNEKKAMLEESCEEVKKKKKLLNNFKKKKEEALKKCNESETNLITKNVFETFQKKKKYFESLQKMLEEAKEEYEILSKSVTNTYKE